MQPMIPTSGRWTRAANLAPTIVLSICAAAQSKPICPPCLESITFCTVYVALEKEDAKALVGLLTK